MLLGVGGRSTDYIDQDLSFLNFIRGFFGTSTRLQDGVWDIGSERGAVA